VKTGRAAKNRATRKRLEARLRRLAFVKKCAWRLTALWCWLHIALAPTRASYILSHWESQLSAWAYRMLIAVGFAPSNQQLLPIVSKLFWILCITQFSWIRISGLASYIMLFPIWVPLRIIFRKTYRTALLQNKTPPNQKGLIDADFSLTSFLTATLLAWFVLYGNSTSRLPLITALILVGWLFGARVYDAFMYTTMLDVGSDGLLARIAKAPFDLLRKLVEQISTGGIKTDDQLRASIKMQSRILRWLRRFSVYLHGREGRRRAALMVLLRYMTNLALLGILTILFWALAIKLYKSPMAISLRDAMLASASHVIPGVPDAETTKVSVGIQAGISLTAWAIFVLYAGPVASMFPMLQERYIKQVREHYETLRIARGLLYRVNEAVMRLFNEKDAKTTIEANLENGSDVEPPILEGTSAAPAIDKVM